MPRSVLIGNHPDVKHGLATSSTLADGEIVTAAGNVDAVHHVRARAIDVVLTDPDTPIQDDLALVDITSATRGPDSHAASSNDRPCRTARPPRSRTLSGGPNWACGRADSG
jgi:hypothetical protein